MAETPGYAHLIALLFLGSGLVIFGCLLVAVVAASGKRARWPNSLPGVLRSPHSATPLCYSESRRLVATFLS